MEITLNSKDKVLEIIINESISLIEENSNKDKNQKALPIITTIFSDEKIFLNINDKWIEKQTSDEKFKTHAEWKCLEELKKEKQNSKGWKILISIVLENYWNFWKCFRRNYLSNRRKTKP